MWVMVVDIVSLRISCGLAHKLQIGTHKLQMWNP